MQIVRLMRWQSSALQDWMCFVMKSLVQLQKLLHSLLSAADLIHPRRSQFRRPHTQLVQRNASSWGASGGISKHPLAKPAWVHEQFFQIAQALPNAGCRSLASHFNQLHSAAGHTISKSWAYERLKRQRHALTLARQRASAAARSGAIGRVWGIDLAGLPLTNGETVPVWGILDRGSRAVLQLEPLERFNSLILLGKLIQAFGEYGKPKAIRTDNASVFKTWAFKAVLRVLGVNQQFTELHSPWQNGRIERLWRTMKEALGTEMKRLRSGARILEEQMRFASLEAMKDVLREFQTFYNFSRPHQALKGQTPAQMWNAQVKRRKERAQKSHTRARVHARRRESPPDP